MRKARSEEDWENRGSISIFGTPKTTVPRPFFAQKNTKNGFKCLKEALNVFQIAFSSPHLHHTLIALFCASFSKPYFPRYPNPQGLSSRPNAPPRVQESPNFAPFPHFRYTKRLCLLFVFDAENV